MNLYIHIEWTKRELDSNLLLATLAAELGVDVLLSDTESFDFLLDKKLIKPGIFHTNSLVYGDKKLKFLKKLKKQNHFITSIDEENGLVMNNLSTFIEVRFNKESLDVVDKIFCWGNYDFEYLKNKFNSSVSKFCLTGAPRVDLWKKKMATYWNTDLKKIKKPYVLFSLNFGIINAHIPIWEKYLKLKRTNFFKMSNDSESWFIDTTSSSLKLFFKFVEAINFLSKECNDINFYIRPHPQESIEPWKLLIDHRENVVVDNQGPINPLIINSSMLVHNSCTTAYEAVLNDIPVLSYHPLKEHPHGKPANELGKIISNLDDLKTNIIDIFEKKVDKKEYINKKIAEDKLNFNQENLSSKKIIDIYLPYFSDKKKKNNWYKIFVNLFIFNIFKKLLFNLIRVIKFNFRKKIISETKFEIKNKNYYQKKINKFCEILNIKSKIKVYKVSEKSILIKGIKN